MTFSLVMMLLLSMVRLSTPIFIAGVGNMFCERVGVLNLGAEGMMITGAFCGVLGSHLTGSAWLGVLCGVLGGGAAGLVHAVICVEFGGMHAIAGLGLNLFAGGFITFLCTSIFKSDITPSVPALNSSPWLAGIPLLGDSLAKLSPLVFVAVGVAAAASFVIYKTPLGLRIQAVGDDPRAVETAGIDVWRTQYLGVVLCGLICGLAGAYMSLGQLDRFARGMTSGKGMLSVIAVKMGKWNPVGIMNTAFLLGFFDAIQLYLQLDSSWGVPPELIQTIPFVAGILVLAFQQSDHSRPTSLDIPYLKNKYKV